MDDIDNFFLKGQAICTCSENAVKNTNFKSLFVKCRAIHININISNV